MKPRTWCRLLSIGVLCAALLSTACHTKPAESPAAPAFRPTAFDVRVIGAGRPVIFIPGLGCAGDVWDAAIRHLGTGVQAHVLTLTGFAGLPQPGTFQLRAVHDQLEAYIKAYDLKHPIVVGHSLGGVLALWLAETDPDLGGAVDVEGLPFLPAVAKPDITPAQAAAAAAQIRERMKTADRPKLAMIMQGTMAAQISKPEQLAHFADEAGRSDPAAISNAMYDLMTTDLRPDLAKIRVHVLVVAAEGTGFPIDAIHTVWHQQVDAIPSVDLEFVPGAKHFVMLDQPDAFDALLAGFLARHGAS